MEDPDWRQRVPGQQFVEVQILTETVQAF